MSWWQQVDWPEIASAVVGFIVGVITKMKRKK